MMGCGQATSKRGGDFPSPSTQIKFNMIALSFELSGGGVLTEDQRRTISAFIDTTINELLFMKKHKIISDEYYEGEYLKFTRIQRGLRVRMVGEPIVEGRQ